MNDWFTQLGPLGWPLLFASLCALALIAERLVYFLSLARQDAGVSQLAMRWLQSSGVASLRKDLRNELAGRQGPLATALCRLIDHAAQPRALREEIMGLWLGGYRKSLHAHLRWLTLIAVVSPLLGLLGTVQGMILSFEDLAAHSGPVHPALLAGGMRIAMLTTFAGLSIAIPALVAAHGFRIWGDHLLEKTESTLNLANLVLEGIRFDDARQSVLPGVTQKEIRGSAG
jgi:biopolymer transport protein ExbB